MSAPKRQRRRSHLKCRLGCLTCKERHLKVRFAQAIVVGLVQINAIALPQLLDLHQADKELPVV